MKEEEKLVQPSFRIQIQQNERMYVRVRETEHELLRSPSAFHYTVKIHSRPFSTSSMCIHQMRINSHDKFVAKHL